MGPTAETSSDPAIARAFIEIHHGDTESRREMELSAPLLPADISWGTSDFSVILTHTRDPSMRQLRVRAPGLCASAERYMPRDNRGQL